MRNASALNSVATGGREDKQPNRREKSPAAPAKRSPAPRTGKAYELLAEQPESLLGLSATARASVVVSAVLDESGQSVVLSRVGDAVWDLSPFIETPNVKASVKRLNWLVIPEPFREVCQNVLYAYWKLGRPGWAVPGVRTLRAQLSNLATFCQHLQAAGVASMVDVQPLHVSNFVHYVKSHQVNRQSQGQKFSAIELLYLFSREHEDGLQFHPWPESSAYVVAGQTGQRCTDARKVSLTPLIPSDVAQALWVHAEGILNRADTLLDERDMGLRWALKDPHILAIRNACAYLIGVLTGVRNSEMSGIELGAGRTETKGQHTFHWLQATEYKTGKGLVDYLMPSMGHRILAVMERWSQPYRDRLAEQIREVEQQETHSANELKWLDTARANQRRLFLGNGRDGIVPLSNAGWSYNFQKFAMDAGTTWILNSHQLRRLYAYTFVRHKLGHLLFLKEQFKHTSINMSQLYAASPLQDSVLFDEILAEIYRQKADVLASWLDKDEPLAGGAGQRIMNMRGQDFEGRRELLMETSKRVLMRSTGHAWCLAQDEGCGGTGIYEKRGCHSCGNGVIDKSFAPLWLEGYRHHKELLKDAQALGPAYEKRVKADLAREAKVLHDLGLDPETVLPILNENEEADRGQKNSP